MHSFRGSSQPWDWTQVSHLQADSLSSDKLKNAGGGSLSLLQGIFPTQESNWISHIAGRFFTSWATREAH